MRRETSALVALMAACAVCGCGLAASDVDFNPQRGISTDISASLYHGPTASYPGMVGREEPLGAFPWELGAHQADGP